MKISREDAIKIINLIVHQDDPYWDNITEDWYDEKSDTRPSIQDVFEALGINEDEYNNIIKN